MTFLKASKQIFESPVNPEELLQTVPDLKLSKLVYLAESTYISDEERQNARNEIMLRIKEDIMAPFYRFICKNLNIFSLDEKLLGELLDKNSKELELLDEKIKDAVSNCGDLEVRNSHYNKLVYLVRIGSKDESLKELEAALEKTIGGYRIELLFLGIRIGLFWNDVKLTDSFLKRCQEQLNTTSDWERKNRLKVYQAVYKLLIRDFNMASELLLDSLTTFTATELMSFEDLIFYTVTSSILCICRKTVKSRLLTSPDILKVALQPDNKYLLEFIESYYYGRYRQFLRILLEIINMFKRDVYLHRHHKFYLRSIRLRIYTQYLEPFESISVSKMAESFGVSSEFLEKDIVTFISSSKLSCTIDKVKQMIICNRIDKKLSSYNELVQKGDILLNRLQKLSRIIQI